MRDRRDTHALPRAPTAGTHEAGLRAVPTPIERLQAARVKCSRCEKVIAEQLHGTLTYQCPRCKHRETISR